MHGRKQPPSHHSMSDAKRQGRGTVTTCLTFIVIITFLTLNNHCLADNAELPVIRMASMGQVLHPYPPFIWLDECSNEPRGSTPHLLKRILNLLGYQLEWVEPPSLSDLKQYPNWQVLFLKQLRHGDTDLAMISPANQDPDLLKTQQPFIVLQEIVTSHRSLPAPKKLTDLKGLRGILSPFSSAKIGEITAYITQVLEQQQIDHVIASSPAEAFRSIKLRQADFTVSNRYLARIMTHNEKMGDNIHFSDWTVLSQSFHLAMPANAANTELLERIDALLIQYREHNFLERIYQTHMKKWISYGNCEPSTSN